MSRPTDWSALQLSWDPVPGDWSDVSSAATRYASIADKITQAKKDLLHVFDDAQLSGEAIDAVRETALQVADRIGRARERYHGVAEALAGYVEPLHSAQDQSLALLNNAVGASGDRTHALHEFQEWERKYDDAVASGDQDAIDHAKRTRDLWQQRYYDSNDDISRAVASLNAIIEHRDHAANRAADLIENVENSGGLNDDFWDKVDEFYDANEGWIDQAIEIAGWIAAALAVIAMFVPGLNVLVLVVAIIVAAAVIANAWAKAGTGRESIAEAIVTTVLAIVPFGIGRVLTVAGAAARSGVANQAANSILHSASGSGMSGLTKPIAEGVIEQFLTKGSTAVKSEFQELVNLSALAKAPILQSGAVATGLKAATASPIGIFVVDVIHRGTEPLTTAFGEDVVNGAVDKVFGDQSANSWQNANW